MHCEDSSNQDWPCLSQCRKFVCIVMHGEQALLPKPETGLTAHVHSFTKQLTVQTYTADDTVIIGLGGTMH